MPGADQKTVASTMKTFENFMINLNVLTSSRLALLTSARLATSIHRSALERVDNAYAQIYSAVTDKLNKYEYASTLMPRGTDEVSTLLGIDTGVQ